MDERKPLPWIQTITGNNPPELFVAPLEAAAGAGAGGRTLT